MSSLQSAYPRTQEEVPPAFGASCTFRVSFQIHSSRSVRRFSDRRTKGKRCFDGRSLTNCRGIAHRAVFVALSFVRSSRRQEQLTTLLPGLASSGLTSNRHSLLVRVDEVQGYQGGQVVPVRIQSRLVRVTPIVIAASECRWRKAYQLPLGSVLDWRPRLCTSLTKASQ